MKRLSAIIALSVLSFNAQAITPSQELVLEQRAKVFVCKVLLGDSFQRAVNVIDEKTFVVMQEFGLANLSEFEAENERVSKIAGDKFINGQSNAVVAGQCLGVYKEVMGIK